ncbi:hypothetical protein F4801DRAFT_530530 [Xylaria longipes]|nr:hypothetical protein F4801DRAFT_530530 [Xylaria longipes]RYC57836.1 hypothetical protein CHU98_g8376 [Xylaria longipes]
MTTPVAGKRFICTDCDAEFSRKDHAKRHKLSHRRPEFACPHPNCGLFFHRRDVLRRHEAVHKPENAEKRRKPRRGPLPPELPRSEGQHQQRPSSTSGSCEPVLMTEYGSVGGRSHTSAPDRESGGSNDWNSGSDEDDPVCLCNVHNGTVCVHCSSEMIRLADGRLPAESQGAIKFCMTHYIQSQLKWLPFIHCLSLRTNWLLSGRALILAALGARGIKEYKTLAGDLWAEAERRVVAWVFSPAPDSDVLYNFQTKILLVEYLQWSENNQLPVWVKPMLDEMVDRESSELADMLVDVPYENAAYGSVKDELCQQEIRWTLWKFYCTMTRASLLGIKLHPPRLFQTLDLPGDPNQLLTLSQYVGRESDGLVRTIRSESSGRGLTLPQVLSVMLADDHRRTALPDMLSISSKYIVLHAILYLSDHMVEEFVGIDVARQDPAGWQVETRERLYLLVMRWRQCFWIPPEVLWSTSFPEFGSLQSIMFVVYLAVRVSQPVRDSANGKRPICSRQPYAQYAMRCIVTMHINMKSNNLLEVAAKGRWFLDGATWRSGGLAAKYAMEWFRDRARFGFEDEDIDFLQSLESVMAFYSYEGSYTGVSYSPARLAQLERSVKHLWTMILGTESWLDSQFEE